MSGAVAVFRTCAGSLLLLHGLSDGTEKTVSYLERKIKGHPSPPTAHTRLPRLLSTLACCPAGFTGLSCRLLKHQHGSTLFGEHGGTSRFRISLGWGCCDTRFQSFAALGVVPGGPNRQLARSRCSLLPRSLCCMERSLRNLAILQQR